MTSSGDMPRVSRIIPTKVSCSSDEVEGRESEVASNSGLPSDVGVAVGCLAASPALKSLKDLMGLLNDFLRVSVSISGLP